MKQLLLILVLLITGNVFSQCDIKRNNRPDGSTIKYFTPKPVAKTKITKQDFHYTIMLKAKNIRFQSFCSIKTELQQN